MKSMKKRATRAAGAIKSRFAKVNGLRLHYLAAGQGEPVILLHGYAQNSHMWRPLIAELAKTRTVIAPDLRLSAAAVRSRAVSPRSMASGCITSPPARASR